MAALRVERAARRLRAAEALVADLKQGLADEQRLAVYYDTGSAQALQEVANSEPTPQIGTVAPREITARAPSPRIAEAELTRYVRALQRAGAESLEAELTPLVHRALVAGLGFEAVSALAEGRTPRLPSAPVAQLDRGRP
jgi:hypothetical protein